eukprot:9275923-Prorocentrum_lima.AAC.1
MALRSQGYTPQTTSATSLPRLGHWGKGVWVHSPALKKRIQGTHAAGACTHDADITSPTRRGG